MSLEEFLQKNMGDGSYQIPSSSLMTYICHYVHHSDLLFELFTPYVGMGSQGL